jgi:biotin transport system ATP-binding protein
LPFLAAPLFTISNVFKTFPNGNRAVCGVSLEIAEGECLIIAGSNGSGKTLLTRMMCGLMDYSAGEIRFRGQPLDKAIAALRQSVGLVFQDADAQIVGETVAEDVAFGPKNLGLSRPDTESRVNAALAATGLTDKRDYPPRRLSGGEKRRLAVAGVLALGCQALIMDEHCANLDWHGVAQVLEIIRQLKAEGKTVIVLTHELEKVLAFADRLVILHAGVIRDDGAPRAVLDRLEPAWGVRDPRRSYDSVEDCSWI